MVEAETEVPLAKKAKVAPQPDLDDGSDAGEVQREVAAKPKSKVDLKEIRAKHEREKAGNA